MLLVSPHDVLYGVDTVRQKSLVAVALSLGVDAHDMLRRVEVGVADDGVEDVVHPRVHSPKHSDIARDELGVQVHVFLAPALDAEVEAPNRQHVCAVHGGDAKAKLPPIPGRRVEVFGVDEAALTLTALAVLRLILAHGLRVVLAEHNGEVHLLA